MLRHLRDKKFKFRLKSWHWNYQDFDWQFLSAQLGANVNKSFRRELGRKLIHLSSLWIPLLIYLAPAEICIFIFSIIFVGDAILEYGNFKKWKWARGSFGTLFCRTLRSKECARQRFQVSGSMYVMAAAILCTALFEPIVAVISMTVMLISDTCSALFGKAFGTRQIYKNKSLEGTTAFFVSALIINILFNQLLTFSYISVVACFLATLAEVYEDKTRIDDNLAIPLAVGVTLTLLG